MAAPSSITNIKPLTRNVGSNELSQTHMRNITAQDSPLMQLSGTQGKQYAASRGLLNSSLAAGSAQNAMIQNAMPMALQDAQRYGSVADQNLSYQNQFRMADKEIGAQFGLQSNQQRWQTGENQAQRTWQAGENEAQRGWQSGESALDRSHQMTMQQSEQAWRTGESALDRSHQSTMQQQDQAWRSGESALDRSFQQDMTREGQQFQADQSQLQRDFAGEQAGLDRTQQSQMQERDIQAREAQIAQQAALEIERMGYAFELNQHNVSQSYAATTAQNTLNAIQAIQMDPNLNEVAKRNAIQNAVDVGNENLAWAATFYDTPLPSLTTPATEQTTINPQA